MDPRKRAGEPRGLWGSQTVFAGSMQGRDLQEQILRAVGDSTHGKASGIREDDTGDSVCHSRDREGCLLEATQVEELMVLTGALLLVSRIQRVWKLPVSLLGPPGSMPTHSS